MKYINQEIFIESEELICAGVSDNTLKSAKLRDSECWNFIDDPSDKRKTLIQFDSLKPQYKDLITTKYGDPYKYLAATIIKQHLITPEQDKQFIQSFLLPDGGSLPTNKQYEYTRACAFLHLLANFSVRQLRAIGFQTANDFMEAVQRLIQSDGVSLPTHYSKLRAKVREYKKSGASCVISRKWCNKNSQKVNDQVCEAVLLEMISHSNQFEDTWVARNYNKWARENNYKPITRSTIGNWRRKNMMTIESSRNGQMHWHNKFNPIITRSRPSAPLLLINSDDNNLDLFFQDGNKKYTRLTLVVVTDAYNDYPLGYAIGKAQTTDLVKSAYLNAVHHVKELTGEHLSWHQIQTDSWGLKQLRPWYESQAIFTPTKTKNARGKSIEQSFGKGWHEKLRVYMNYSGYNITAKHQSNWDAIRANSKNFPAISDGILQIAHFINRIRTEANDRTGISKQQQWLDAYQTMLPEHKKYLTDTDRLLIFGMQHQYENKLTNAGFKISINKNQLTYDVPKDDYIQHVGKTMQLRYDPYDFTTMLATMDDGRVKILCPLNQPAKMALRDTTPQDRAALNVRLRDKKEIGQFVLDEQTARKDLLKQNKINAESLLQAGVLIKEDRHLAENTYYESMLLEESITTDGVEPESTEEYFTGDRFDLAIRNEQREGAQ